MEVTLVLVEEAQARGNKCLGCPHVDQDLRLLAGVVNPAGATVCEDSYISPCVGGTLSPSDSVAVGLEGTLSSSDLAGMLFPAVPAGVPFPVGPVGLCGTL